MSDPITRVAVRWLLSRKMQPIQEKEFANSLVRFSQGEASKLDDQFDATVRSIGQSRGDQLEVWFSVQDGGYFATYKTPALESFIKKLRDHLSIWAAHRGWFIDMFNDEQLPGIYLTFEKNYTEEEKPKQFLYHLTDANLTATIQKQGLKPEHKRVEWGYPDRVYVFRNKRELEEGLRYNKEAWSEGGRTLTRTRNVVIFQIDTSKLRKGTKFHIDRDWQIGSETGAWYTYTHIPPEAISVLATKTM